MSYANLDSRCDLCSRELRFTPVLMTYWKFSGAAQKVIILLQKLEPRKSHRSSCLLKKETLAQVFSCGFCEISKNTFFSRTPPVAASQAREIKRTTGLTSQYKNTDVCYKSV